MGGSPSSAPRRHDILLASALAGALLIAAVPARAQAPVVVGGTSRPDVYIDESVLDSLGPSSTPGEVLRGPQQRSSSAAGSVRLHAPPGERPTATAPQPRKKTTAQTNPKPESKTSGKKTAANAPSKKSGAQTAQSTASPPPEQAPTPQEQRTQVATTNPNPPPAPTPSPAAPPPQLPAPAPAQAAAPPPAPATPPPPAPAPTQAASPPPAPAAPAPPSPAPTQAASPPRAPTPPAPAPTPAAASPPAPTPPPAPAPTLAVECESRALRYLRLRAGFSERPAAGRERRVRRRSEWPEYRPQSSFPARGRGPHVRSGSVASGGV